MDTAANPYARLKELIQLKQAGKLGFNEVRELISLHERAAADLSLAGERGAAEQETLKSLVAESFNAVYGLLPLYKRPPLEFLRTFYTCACAWAYSRRQYFHWTLFLRSFRIFAGDKDKDYRVGDAVWGSEANLGIGDTGVFTIRATEILPIFSWRICRARPYRNREFLNCPCRACIRPESKCRLNSEDIFTGIFRTAI